jgi:glycosyltransferase involved in cell wall biosynthesis
MSALFVGSFKHTPNADGIIWFLDEVLQQILEVIPDFHLKIVGENPPEYLKSYESDHVEILGWVPDLDPLLYDSRVSVSPLRFGAGVKGKISQALSFGLPLVTTSIGAEGMSLRNGVDSMICDSSQDFAEGVIHLLTDDLLWHHLSANGQETAEIFYGQKYAREQISQLFEIIDRG